MDFSNEILNDFSTLNIYKTVFFLKCYFIFTFIISNRKTIEIYLETEFLKLVLKS